MSVMEGYNSGYSGYTAYQPYTSYPAYNPAQPAHFNLKVGILTKVTIYNELRMKWSKSRYRKTSCLN